jgi:hypothetical protein
VLKCKALTKKAWIDDLEMDEEGVGDLLMGKLLNLKKKTITPYKKLQGQELLFQSHFQVLREEFPKWFDL